MKKIDEYPPFSWFKAKEPEEPEKPLDEAYISIDRDKAMKPIFTMPYDTINLNWKVTINGMDFTSYTREQMEQRMRAMANQRISRALDALYHG